MKKFATLMLAVCFSSLSLASTEMTQALMEKVVKEMTPESRGEKGVVEFSYHSVDMYLISDVAHNRMRIIAPIVEYKQLEQQHIEAVLKSNFHHALDARYAVSDGVLFSVYIHPLKELTEDQIKSAVQQVSNLALSFGKQYTSGVLAYGTN